MLPRDSGSTAGNVNVVTKSGTNEFAGSVYGFQMGDSWVGDKIEDQSVTIGEVQHAFNEGKVSESDVTPIGQVINGDHKGRTSENEITLFDGTGVGLQDLAVASVAVDLAIKGDQAQTVLL